MPSVPSSFLVIIVLCLPRLLPAGPPGPPKISPARVLQNGIREHSVQSPYQKAETKLRVLLPPGLDVTAKRPVLYLFPVESGEETRYGDPLDEILKLKLHEKYQLVCVVPTFDRMPWFADHPTDPLIRQESHFVKGIIPFIDQAYPVEPGRSGRWLLGFSKGGWGAFSLLLRHPEMFDRAAAWDVPFTLKQPDRYGMGEIFGTQENFNRYRLPLLLETSPQSFRTRTRLVLTGYELFRSHHQELHQQMLQSKILHGYLDGPQRAHRWNSGWLPEAVKLLSELPADRSGGAP